MGTHYGTSPITAPATYQHLATGFVVGTRFHSAPVLRVADARPLHLGNVAAADGRWRLYAFSGTDDPVDGDAGVRALCNFLSESTESPIFRYTRPGDDIDALFDVRAIFQRSDQLDIEAMPALLLPRKGRYGLLDYEKVFWSDPRNGDIFDLRGIDRKRGALVVVRPDQYIANVLPLDAHEALAAFFAGFMLLNGSG